MWVEVIVRGTVSSQLGRNTTRNKFFYPHFVPDGTSFLIPHCITQAQNYIIYPKPDSYTQLGQLLIRINHLSLIIAVCF
jgi:hypothetical protein